MTKITLYKYEREPGHTTVSPIKPDDKEYTIMFRLVADDGMDLVKEDIRTKCIDVDSADGWEEVPELPEEHDD